MLEQGISIHPEQIVFGQHREAHEKGLNPSF